MWLRIVLALRGRTERRVREAVFATWLHVLEAEWRAGRVMVRCMARMLHVHLGMGFGVLREAVWMARAQVHRDCLLNTAL